MFGTREITSGSAVDGDKRAWVIEQGCQVSADLLLMNTNDRTPIVAEFKRGGDRNADYALVRTLAAAAQLTPARQWERLRAQYSEYFGKHLPERLDVNVIVTNPPPRGTRPKLPERARTHAGELRATGTLDPWIRRIVFLEVKASAGCLSFAERTRSSTARPIAAQPPSSGRSTLRPRRIHRPEVAACRSGV